MSVAKYFERDRHTESLRNWNSFKNHQAIGSGTYGEVFKAQDVMTGEIVVLKKVKYNHTLVRELEIMAKMNHVNVLKLRETFSVSRQVPGGGTDRHIVLVFEYMEHDLSRLRRARNNKFSQSEIKCYMQQLLLGLHYLHSNGVLHRDIKGENLLINNNGILKIADFGLAKSLCLCHKGKPLTGPVVTLYYRPPELLLGQTVYGPEVDIWSVGCVFAEFFLTNSRDRLFFGNGEIAQLEKIFGYCGMPNEDSWPGFTSLTNGRKTILKSPARDLKWKNLISSMDPYPYAKDLLLKMLQLCPSRRISAKGALNSEYFWTDPLPCHPSSIAKYGATTTAEYHDEKNRQKIPVVEERSPKKRKLSQPNPNLPLTQGPVARGLQTNIDQAGGAGGAPIVVTGRGPGLGRGRGRGQGQGLGLGPGQGPVQGRGQGPVQGRGQGQGQGPGPGPGQGPVQGRGRGQGQGQGPAPGRGQGQGPGTGTGQGAGRAGRGRGRGLTAPRPPRPPIGGHGGRGQGPNIAR